MIFTGERMNAGFKDVKQAVIDHNADAIEQWAIKQTEAKATYLDGCLGTAGARTEDFLKRGSSRGRKTGSGRFAALADARWFSADTLRSCAWTTLGFAHPRRISVQRTTVSKWTAFPVSIFSDCLVRQSASGRLQLAALLPK